MTRLEKIAAGFRLLEGPVWDPTSGLVFADAEGGGVFGLNETGTGPAIIVQHRRGIGGLVRHQAGGLVVSGRNVAYKGTDISSTVVLLDNTPEISGMVGFSDMCADAAGRVLAGMLGSRPTEENHLSDHGSLWLIDLDGSARCLIPSPKVRHTNGLAFSPDDTSLYYADSGQRAVFVYDYDVACGRVGEPRLFATMDAGIPDGLAVAADGSVWVANAFASRVLVFGPDGGLQRTINIPQEIVTNVCFGGTAMDEVFITTGSLNPAERVGAVYHLSNDVPGLQTHQAKCPVLIGAAPPAVSPKEDD
ncbi:SMP-30/gluconolactonase/LRE family protein [Arthrobacter dokdonensis]|uniref:SMP-30/gluconolactonase/LRE family protein n=1 Tax=Arthrobacter dokdonellae TaxID=2211210 RepID=UPI000DE57E02|nr:SMP-30/gluconolactonase/LRE family protein [Arthrobacter dokdonellae]